MCAKVTDGYSLRELQKLLRVSQARLRYLIRSGILRIRDPRVTGDSLAAYCARNSLSLNPSALKGVNTALVSIRVLNFLAIFRPAGRDLIDVDSGSMDVPGLINPPYRQRAPVETVRLSLR